MIKELTLIENILLRTGAVVMVAGLALNLIYPIVGMVMVGVGTICFALMQWRAQYIGTDFTLARLRRQQLLSCTLLVIGAALLAQQTLQLTPYLQHGEWALAMGIGAFVQLYTAWRIPAELEKKTNK